MSIIEKAVSKLEDKEIPEAESAESSAVPSNEDTVQRAVAADPAPEKTAVESPSVAPPGVETAPAADVAMSAETAVKPRSSDRFLEIAFDELHERGIVTPLVPRSRIAEEFRTIKRPLLRNIDSDGAAPLPNANLIMVTSAMQGDGKTFNSISLAISIAMELDKTVLFVDADIARASACRMLGVPDGQPGLLDLLENPEIGVEDVLLRTNMPKLTLIPTGRVREHSNELLASAKMQTLMHELSRRYHDRVIVFDSPPLLLTTEAAVLASFMGQIAFVVAADQTPQKAVTDALERIGEDKMVGLILNKARKRHVNPFGIGGGHGYSYGYGYGYGYGPREEPAEQTAPPGSSG